MLPLDSLNSIDGKNSKGIYFNPESNGLIVQERNSPKKATFLPNVFDNKTKWNYIKEQLIEKARITTNKIDFYSYNIIQNKIQLKDFSIKKYTIGIR